MKILSFVALVFGGFNWFCIGFLQYDIVAGFFGFQASIFSRLVYVAVGIATINVVVNVLKNKGKLVLWTRKNKQAKGPESYQSANNAQHNVQHLKSENSNLQQYEQQTIFDQNKNGQDETER